MKLEQWARAGKASTFNLTMTRAAQRDQVGQLIGIHIISIEFTIWLDVVNNMIVFFKSQLFTAYLTFASIAFNCQFALIRPVFTAIKRHASAIKMAICTRFQCAVTYPFTFSRAVSMLYWFATVSFMGFSTNFTFLNLPGNAFVFAKTFTRTKFSLIESPRSKLFPTIDTGCYMDFFNTMFLIAFGRTIFAALGGFCVERFSTYSANRGMLIHSNERPFVARSWGASNTSRNLFVLNYSAQRSL